MGLRELKIKLKMKKKNIIEVRGEGVEPKVEIEMTGEPIEGVSLH